MMKRIRLEPILVWSKYFAFGLFTLYLVSMVAWPFIASGGDWFYVQTVWDRWQGFNVGVLALVSSVVAFYLARYKAEKQREREFRASNLN